MPAGSIAVVGAGLAGLRACEGLRQRGFEGRITLVGDEPRLPYDRPPLSKQFLAGQWDLDRVVLRSPEQMAALGLDLRIGPAHRAVALDLAARRLRLLSGDTVEYDGLVLATGSAARRLPAINDLPGAYVLRTLDDALALRTVLQIPGVRLGLAGAGFIGLEVAATARRLGVDVTVVEPLDVPLGRVLGPVSGGACEVMHREEGVRFHLRTVIESVEVGDAGTGIGAGAGIDATGPLRCRLSSGQVLEFDALLVGIGAAPSVSWLADSGLRAGPDGIVCDGSLMAAPGVAVAGDVARWPLPVDHADGYGGAEAPETVRVEHRTNAAEQGDHAAASLLAHLGLLARQAQALEVPPSYVVPYVWSDQYNVKIQVLGLPRPDDEVIVVEGDPSERRFVALHGRGGRLQAVVGFARPRHVMTLRPLLERKATLVEAAAMFS
ncbi:MAG: FAD-dependent oxidoreductase [Acidimicrobiales bacterium]|jgi:3-phenylpropionate/trans-cinnamate dioxygenase ferredoxin reductase subunit